MFLGHSGIAESLEFGSRREEKMKPEFIGEIRKDIEWTISTLGSLEKDGRYEKEPDCLGQWLEQGVSKCA